MTLSVQLVSPEQILYEGEADMVICRTLGGGDIAFQTGHSPFLGALASWPVKLYLTGGDTTRFASHGGFVQVADNRVIILSDVAELPGAIDAARALAAKQRAEDLLRTQADDAEALAALARANTRLEVAATT